mgnify:CR=1 FL=1
MDNPSRVLEQHVELIRTIVRKVCSRSGLREVDVEDVTSYAFERFVENDYKVIREFEGEALSQSYLVLVTRNICNDYFRQRSGRWRPSTKAQELGDLAIRVEELLYKDRCSFEEMFESIDVEWSNRGLTPPSRYDLEEVALQLKPKSRPITHTSEEDYLGRAAAVTPDYSDVFRSNELHPQKQRLDQFVQQLKRKLDDDARLVFQFYFNDNHRISSIARTLAKSRYQVKQILDTNLERFRQAIYDEGFDPSDISEILDYFS